MDIVTIIGIIIIALFAIAYSVVKITKKEKVTKNTTDNKIENGVSNNFLRKDDKKIQRKNVTDFLEFDKIVDDMIVQDKESKFTMAIQCKGINYDLMSEIEQLSIEEGFINFLNTLKYPIQLYVQARTVDLKKNIDIYNTNVNKINQDFKVADDNLKKMNTDDNYDYEDIQKASVEKVRFQNMLEYAKDITKYVERISLNKHLLQRRFYIIFSYNKAEINSISQFTKSEVLEICHRELYTRAQSIISGLMGCSVEGKVLTSNQLAELLYISYNRDDEKIIDIKAALESGFYRLYSTSKDAFDKKQELLQKEIDIESQRRVKEAIVEGVTTGKIKTRQQLEEEYEERVDRGAIDIINESDLSQGAKEQVKEIIAENHIKDMSRRQEQRAEKIRNEQEKLIRLKEENEEQLIAENKEKELNIKQQEIVKSENKVENEEEIIIKKDIVVKPEEKVESAKEELNIKTNDTTSDEDESIV